MPNSPAANCSLIYAPDASSESATRIDRMCVSASLAPRTDHATVELRLYHGLDPVHSSMVSIRRIRNGLDTIASLTLSLPSLTLSLTFVSSVETARVYRDY
jgi:hypothetical protein